MYGKGENGEEPIEWGSCLQGVGALSRSQDQKQSSFQGVELDWEALLLELPSNWKKQKQEFPRGG